MLQEIENGKLILCFAVVLSFSGFTYGWEQHDIFLPGDSAYELQVGREEAGNSLAIVTHFVFSSSLWFWLGIWLLFSMKFMSKASMGCLCILWITSLPLRFFLDPPPQVHPVLNLIVFPLPLPGLSDPLVTLNQHQFFVS